MANNPGGTGRGAGMEMAMGVMMANQMGGALAARPTAATTSRPSTPWRRHCRSHGIQSGDRQSTVRPLRRQPAESHGR